MPSLAFSMHRASVSASRTERPLSITSLAKASASGAPAVTITTDNQYDSNNAQQALDSGTAY